MALVAAEPVGSERVNRAEQDIELISGDDTPIGRKKNIRRIEAEKKTEGKKWEKEIYFSRSHGFKLLDILFSTNLRLYQEIRKAQAPLRA
jgi:hypothetical protein